MFAPFSWRTLVVCKRSFLAFVPHLGGEGKHVRLRRLRAR
jgi:hypothetical protein